MSPLVLALAGTDHHPFDRLVAWVDAAATRHHDVRFLVQHGTARPPAAAAGVEGVEFLAHDRLVELLAAASAVVCHGGPGLVLEAREAGHLPLCLPRDPGLGEHVDGHQQRFAALMGRLGVVRDVRTASDFEVALAAALGEAPGHDPGSVTLREVRDAARARVADELEQLVSAGRPHRFGRRSHGSR